MVKKWRRLMNLSTWDQLCVSMVVQKERQEKGHCKKESRKGRKKGVGRKEEENGEKVKEEERKNKRTEKEKKKIEKEDWGWDIGANGDLENTQRKQRKERL